MKPLELTPEELAVAESAECGYIVTTGHTYCRDCGGGGWVHESDRECVECQGRGEFPIDPEAS